MSNSLSFSSKAKYTDLEKRNMTERGLEIADLTTSEVWQRWDRTTSAIRKNHRDIFKRLELSRKEVITNGN